MSRASRPEYVEGGTHWGWTVEQWLEQAERHWAKYRQYRDDRGYGRRTRYEKEAAFVCERRAELAQYNGLWTLPALYFSPPGSDEPPRKVAAHLAWRQLGRRRVLGWMLEPPDNAIAISVVKGGDPRNGFFEVVEPQPAVVVYPKKTRITRKRVNWARIVRSDDFMIKTSLKYPPDREGCTVSDPSAGASSDRPTRVVGKAVS